MVSSPQLSHSEMMVVITILVRPSRNNRLGHSYRNYKGNGMDWYSWSRIPRAVDYSACYSDGFYDLVFVGPSGVGGAEIKVCAAFPAEL